MTNKQELERATKNLTQSALAYDRARTRALNAKGSPPRVELLWGLVRLKEMRLHRHAVEFSLVTKLQRMRKKIRAKS